MDLSGYSQQNRAEPRAREKTIRQHLGNSNDRVCRKENGGSHRDVPENSRALARPGDVHLEWVKRKMVKRRRFSDPPYFIDQKKDPTDKITATIFIRSICSIGLIAYRRSEIVKFHLRSNR